MTTYYRLGITSDHHPLEDGNPPSWASAWGQDRYGVWVEFTLEDGSNEPVTQRMRWIPPGRFLMGSPVSEHGDLAKADYEKEWFESEGPRHEVIISQGYWLFDTPCTQALWQAVKGNSPSEYQSPQRPVEQVSWDDCQDFLQRLNERIPGLNVTLPTEAQWEHACRAGEQEAIYTGSLESRGDANAPELHPIAWYGGNSGVDFELKEGYEIDYLSDRQFDQNPSGTHPVGLKQPNAWGLYDMLGNVWEWCRDGKRDYRDQPETDPQGPTEAGARRVVRGGSWRDRARFCRSACRSRVVPGRRGNSLGFRPARVQA